MVSESLGVTVGVILVISALLVITGLKKQPGIGVLGALIIIALSMWMRGEDLASLGFGAPPAGWGQTVVLGLVLGILIQLFSVAVLEPLTEKITKSPHDHSLVDSVKGSWIAFLQWMLAVWLLVALVEEGVYRGFLMTEIAKVAGFSTSAELFNILFTSIIFGLSHGYQGRSGMLSTGVVGVFLGAIFIFCGYNLWLAVFTHGFIDTIGIGLISIGGDKYIQRRLWKSERLAQDSAN